MTLMAYHVHPAFAAMPAQALLALEQTPNATG